MATNPKDVFIGSPGSADPLVTAHILTGPETDTIPAGIDDVVTTGLVPSGHVNEDGVTITPSETTETIRDGALNVVRRILTEFDGTIAWTHIDLSVASLRNYMGEDNVDVVAATAAHGTQTRSAINGKERPIKAWYFLIKDGERAVVVLVPHGQVTERGEIPLTASGAVTLPVTLSTYPDADGNSIYIYTDDGVVAGSAG